MTSPNHIAFIMDGNRRYAKVNNIEIKQAYKLGIGQFLNIIKFQIEKNIKNTSFFALSYDNYKKRETNELIPIIDLIKLFLKNKKTLNYLKENKVKVQIKGNQNSIKENPRFEEENQNFIENLRDFVEKIFLDVKDPKYFANIAINYDGQEEITYALNSLIKTGKKEITKEDIKKELYFNDTPEPQIIVRTGNAPRLSGFLLWDSAYSEIYLTKKLWPELEKKDLENIINWYSNIKRNFGK